MHRVFWEATETPEVFKIIWTTSSVFQLKKPLLSHLTELQTNGMTNLVGGEDLPDDISSTEKITIRLNSYISVVNGKAAPINVPLTAKEIAMQQVAEQALIDQQSGKAKLLALGLSSEEIQSLLGV